MVKSSVKVISTLVFLGALVLAVLLYLQYRYGVAPEVEPLNVITQTRIVYPQGAGLSEGEAESATASAGLIAKVALDEGQTVLTVLTQNFDTDEMEEQFIVWRVLANQESPTYLSYVDKGTSGNYAIEWTLEAPPCKPGTLSLRALDLLGDHGICLVLSGIRSAGEHMLYAWRRVSGAAWEQIADISLDGNIAIDEPVRSQAYQRGQTSASPFNITAYSSDPSSGNLLDQIRISYEWDGRLYRQTNVVRVPGQQVEQQRLQELLSGTVENFEAFLDGIWYLTAADGSIDGRQYIYFDSRSGEVVYYDGDVWQDYRWTASNTTRLGLYLSCQNVSVASMTRQMDVELTSLNTVSIRVTENLNLKIDLGRSWDGVYRKTALPGKSSEVESVVAPYIEADFSGAMGDIHFDEGGLYTRDSGSNSTLLGRYTFYMLSGQKMLDMRPGFGGLAGETYLVTESSEGSLGLQRVNLTTNGFTTVIGSLYTLLPPGVGSTEEPAGIALAEEIQKQLGETNTGAKSVSVSDSGITINLAIQFQANTAALLSGEDTKLDNLAAILRDYSGKILVAGFTADTNDPAGELSLSRERAQAVADYLLKAGTRSFSSDFIVRGYGAAMPIADNSTAEGKSANRRVEITLLSEDFTDLADL
jgi:outer membrane protein OmpA-like peptidoglycan-associated protein